MRVTVGTVVLPSPEWGDSKKAAHKSFQYFSMSFAAYSYSYATLDTILDYRFENIQVILAKELQDFLRRNHDDRFTIVDHNSVSWSVLSMSDPYNITVGARRCEINPSTASVTYGGETERTSVQLQFRGQEI